MMVWFHSKVDCDGTAGNVDGSCSACCAADKIEIICRKLSPPKGHQHAPVESASMPVGPDRITPQVTVRADTLVVLERCVMYKN